VKLAASPGGRFEMDRVVAARTQRSVSPTWPPRTPITCSGGAVGGELKRHVAQVRQRDVEPERVADALAVDLGAVPPRGRCRAASTIAR